MQSDLIERLKRCVDMADVISLTGDTDRFESLPLEGKTTGHHCTTTGEKKCVVRVDQGWWRCHKCQSGGDIVAWVVSRSYQGDKSKKRNAVQDIVRFASLEEGESTIDAAQHDVYGMLTDLSWQWHQALLDRPDLLVFLKKGWGLNRLTIEELRLGYCSGAAYAGYTHTEMLSGGLINEKSQQPLNQRITIPYFQDGQVVWFSGRAIVSGGVKYQDINATEYTYPTLYNFDNAYQTTSTEALLFTEGLLDAARAYQDGYRVVATGGANRFGKELQTATKTLLQVCTGSKYICYDSEKSGTGLEGSKKLAQALLNMGHNPLILQLPRKDEVKVDLSDFLNRSPRNSQGHHAFDYLVEEAWRGIPQTLPNLLLQELPDNANSDKIRDLIKVVAQVDPLERDAYTKAITARFPWYTAKALKVALTEASKKKKKLVKGKPQMAENFTRTVCLANDYEYMEDLNIWRVHTATYAPYEELIEDDNGYERIVQRLRLVCISVDLGVNNTWSISKQDIVDDAVCDDLGRNRPDECILTLDTNMWSIDRHSPYSFRNFIEGATPRVDLLKLYKDMYALVEEYVWLPYEGDKVLMVLYAIFTYTFMGFDGVPYMHFRGELGTGKSTSMDLMAYFCYNTMGCSSLTEAILFRMAHSTRPTLFIAESEKLENPAPGSPHEAMLSVCLEGYANSANAAVYRCNVDDKTKADLFKTYGPRVFGSIKALKDTLTSRSITIHTRTTDPQHLRKLAAWGATKRYREKILQDIRNRARVWAITQFRTLRDAFDAITDDKEWEPGISGRAKEIYQPLLALAKVIEQEGQSDFYEEALKIVHFKIHAAKAEELEQGFVNLTIKAVYGTWMECRNAVTIGYMEIEGWHGKSAICLPMLLQVVKTRMAQAGNWDDKKNSMDAKFLRNILKNFGAIPDGYRRTNRRIGVENNSVELIEFDGVRLEEYVRLKGLILTEEEQ